MASRGQRATAFADAPTAFWVRRARPRFTLDFARGVACHLACGAIAAAELSRRAVALAAAAEQQRTG